MPVIPGTTEPIYDVRNGKKEARRIGYPVMIKAALGGGGKGMRAAFTEEEFDNAFQTAQTEAKKAFGDDTMYIEHFVEHPRHIEFQILADSKGNVIHLGERGLLHPEKPPEGHRGGPLPGYLRQTAEKDGGGGGESRQSGPLRQCRHHRVPAGEERAVLLYGNEHKDPGGAPR